METKKIDINGILSVTVDGFSADVIGGPYEGVEALSCPTVKLTERPCTRPPTVEFVIPDFSVPDDDAEFRLFLIYVFRLMRCYGTVAVGCTAGLGRTGMVLACIEKVAIVGNGFRPVDYGGATDVGAAAVAEVRRRYCRSAVETKEQEAYVRDFDAGMVLVWYRRPWWLVKLAHRLGYV